MLGSALGGSWNVAEVLFDVALGAEEALLFAGPEGDADGTPGLDIAKRLKDAHGFHGDDGAGSVVGGSGGGDPGSQGGRRP